jgi:hypothetical protein
MNQVVAQPAVPLKSHSQVLAEEDKVVESAKCTMLYAPPVEKALLFLFNLAVINQFTAVIVFNPEGKTKKTRATCKGGSFISYFFLL